MTLMLFQIVFRISNHVHIQVLGEDVTLSPHDAMESRIAQTGTMKPTVVRNN